MTAKQDKYYWREWAKVVKACKEHKFDLPDRHELHRRALGKDKSHKDFTNDDFTKVLQMFWSLSKPTSLGAQLRQERMPRQVLLFRIQNDQVAELEAVKGCTRLDAERFVSTIMISKFGTADFSLISDQPVPRKSGVEKSDLETLRDTLAARINQLRKQAGMTIHDMRTAAGLKCPCAKCKRGSRIIVAEPTPGTERGWASGEDVLNAWKEEH